MSEEQRKLIERVLDALVEKKGSVFAGLVGLTFALRLTQDEQELRQCYASLLALTLEQCEIDYKEFAGALQAVVDAAKEAFDMREER